ncbi:hypothetical protein [Conexibacter woesei]|uniref:Uncharacterized protein n=1 Tax=Conexibacter woesei (strain DSM 14684 / CCUG 47730 / CIP 108061 / JCM 11494 / NBRC 100937 / ID131577) TaxID=469383 RepID=D3FCU7_CONWI|nr:hypothetical protein [Conexibacter woesei]ADB51459.1 hypothetical protein Cwoe_3040 [Conexibacter woesei DSM 14684]
MLYEQDGPFPRDRSGDSPLDPRQLLADISALIEAGLVVPVRDRDGQVRMTPAEPLEVERPAS